MTLGQRIAVMSDIHGEYRVLIRVLEECRNDGVNAIVLLGDLFDRLDQARVCADVLADWPVAGVLGNHERDALRQITIAEDESHARRLVERLDDRFRLDEALFVHDMLELTGDEEYGPGRKHLVFTGHTHVRS
ncbi:MAG: metallophosphoesterase family protein, partial [Thermomicrobiaceae bacterium]